MVKATLVEEALSLVEAKENKLLLANCIAETMPHKKKVNTICYTDSKFLYDATNTTTKIINDKRLRIEMAVVREMMERNEIGLE